MKELLQFPCSWAAIYGCHISLKCPASGLQANKEYHNFNFPGNSHDLIILQSTSLWGKITGGQTIPDISKDIEGVKVPPLILGDSAFSFQSWLIKPYTGALLTPSHQYFNYMLSIKYTPTQLGVTGSLLPKTVHDAPQKPPKKWWENQWVIDLLIMFTAIILYWREVLRYYSYVLESQSPWSLI